MDFSLNEDQANLKRSAIEFAQRELNGNLSENEKRGLFNADGWKKCADFGIQGLFLPENFGGLNLDIETCIAVMEGLGQGCGDNGLLFALNSHLWTCESPLMKFGTVEQKEKYLPRLARGEIMGGHAMTEPNAGSDAFAMKCRAVRQGNQFILNGTKMFITNAPQADILLVFAVTDPLKKFAGITAFLVEKGTPGFSVGKRLELMGLKTCLFGEVILQDCKVPESAILGKEGAGAAIFNSEMEWERCCLFATHVGAMQRDLEACIQYAKDRRQFGRPIGQNQAISHKIADMEVRVELSRLILYKVVSLKARQKRIPLESAVSKLFISESYVTNCLDALQIHGAYGYSAEFEFERNLRDSIAGKIYSGTSEIQRNIIASSLGL
jgi:alkylation response protein AidB-like acyl-CoA dehydrogenase